MMIMAKIIEMMATTDDGDDNWVYSNKIMMTTTVMTMTS